MTPQTIQRLCGCAYEPATSKLRPGCKEGRNLMWWRNEWMPMAGVEGSPERWRRFYEADAEVSQHIGWCARRVA